MSAAFQSSFQSRKLKAEQVYKDLIDAIKTKIESRTTPYKDETSPFWSVKIKNYHVSSPKFFVIKDKVGNRICGRSWVVQPFLQISNALLLSRHFQPTRITIESGYYKGCCFKIKPVHEKKWSVTSKKLEKVTIIHKLVM